MVRNLRKMYDSSDQWRSTKMGVDSRQKGARAEAALVKLLKQDTGMNWKRVPGSGALHEDHGLKGDVYLPNEKNYWAIEVKHYKDTQLTSKVLTDKDPMLLQWWSQAVRQGLQTDKFPILFFKHDRSKWFVMVDKDTVQGSEGCKIYLTLHPQNTLIVEYSEFKQHILPTMEWIK